MSDTLEQRRYDRGYAEQTTWLRDGQLALADALHCLSSREATCAADAYNAGAQAATEDHIKRLERAGAS